MEKIHVYYFSTEEDHGFEEETIAEALSEALRRKQDEGHNFEVIGAIAFSEKFPIVYEEYKKRGYDSKTFIVVTSPLDYEQGSFYGMVIPITEEVIEFLIRLLEGKL